MIIRKSIQTDLQDIIKIHREAFGQEDEAELTELLLQDPTAQPAVSLIAFDRDTAAGHILFTKASVTGPADAPLSYILAPLGVLPSYQNRGIGGRLIRKGLVILEEEGVELVFVLGHPGYYPKHGFAPAVSHGFEAPYPIPAEHSDAWMVQELKIGALDANLGTVKCSAVLGEEKYWRE